MSENPPGVILDGYPLLSGKWWSRQGLAGPRRAPPFNVQGFKSSSWGGSRWTL